MKSRSSNRPDAGWEHRSAASARAAAHVGNTPASAMADARTASLAQLQHQDMANNSSQSAQLKSRANMMAAAGVGATAQRVEVEALLQGKFEPVQHMEDEDFLQGKFAARPTVQRRERPNHTGLPNQLKSGIESLSGMRMDHVKVHYNSDKPAQLNAHAYAQGSDIHMAPGQERHLPHEVWHVVQQAQGRVRPTLQLKDNIQVNNDVGLESEADLMGARAAGISRPSIASLVAPARIARLPAAAGASTIQRLPDKNQLFMDRLRNIAGGPVAGAMGPHLAAFVLANPASVGPAVHAAVTAAANVAVGGVGGMTSAMVQNTIVAALAPQLAAPGQFAADSAFNAQVTAALIANPFMQSVMDGSLHAQVSGRRGTAPVAGAIPALPVGTDDRVLESADMFNRLTNLPAPLPPVVVQPTMPWVNPGAAMGGGNLQIGAAAARGNLVHEFGHHLEDNLSPADFTTVHNFLSARTQMPPGGMPPGLMAGTRESGYFFEHHPGYDADMPEINAGGLAGRAPANGWFQQARRALTTPIIAGGQALYRGLQATPIRYLGLLASGLTQQAGRVASGLTGRREPRNWGGHGVEDFFVFNANNRQINYSSVVHRLGAAGYAGTTEFLSTTVEFFNRPSHARELVNQDPLRAALFLRLGNRPQYILVRAAFNLANPPHDLDNLIHVIQ